MDMFPSSTQALCRNPIFLVQPKQHPGTEQVAARFEADVAIVTEASIVHSFPLA